MKKLIFPLLIVILSALHTNISHGQLFSEDFDVDSTSNWTVNLSIATDSNADIFFDYSTVGIPSAPNSSGGTTRGMRLQANLFSQAFGGMSVSPTGQSFTGDYVLSYDMWQSYQAVTFVPADDPFPAGGGIIQGQASGGTNLGYGGIMSSGIAPNAPGDVEAVFFASTTDGDSGSDFRVYSSDIPESYQLPVRPEQPKDLDATYFAETRNNTGDLYVDNFGPESPTAEQASLYPTQMTLDPENMTSAGTLGFAWREHTITKIGDIVTWAVDGIDLIELDTSNFTTPAGGENIMFGHSDVNNGSSINPESFDLLFTLVDNVKVETFVPPTDNADFDGDIDVDGADFLTWQRGNGISDGSASLGDGDANGDGNVDSSDLAIWQGQYGPGTLQDLSATTVPEPATWFSAVLAILTSTLFSRARLAPELVAKR